MEHRSKCKICGGAGEFICATPNEHGRVQEIRSARCRDCGLVFVTNVLFDQDLSEAYADLDAEQYYQETRRETARKIQAACRALEHLAPAASAPRILDIGCGTGDFLLELHRRGYSELAGHEIPGSDLSPLTAAGIRTYRDMDWTGVPAQSFDIVTLLDVAEHVREPLALFQQCRRVLRAGGTLYFHTPVVTRLDRMMHAAARTSLLGGVGRAWQRARTSVFHLQNYSDRSLELSLAQAGFSGVRIQRRNELSWPFQRYVQVYVCEKQRIPAALAPVLAPALYPFLATGFFNSNKGIVTAQAS